MKITLRQLFLIITIVAVIISFFIATHKLIGFPDFGFVYWRITKSYLPFMEIEALLPFLSQFFTALLFVVYPTIIIVQILLAIAQWLLVEMTFKFFMWFGKIWERAGNDEN